MDSRINFSKRPLFSGITITPQKEVQWSSGFYSYRSGTGKGNVQKKGMQLLKLSLKESWRIHTGYTYKWISDIEYELKSVQYNNKDKPTGSFYGGTFIKNK